MIDSLWLGSIFSSDRAPLQSVTSEDVMGKMNWGRVFLCGILTGVVLYLLKLLVFVFALGKTDLAAAVEAAGHPRFPALPFILNLGVGTWTMWLYAAIRQRYGPGPKTAAVAGLALWAIGALVDALWVSFRLTPISLSALLAPLAAALPVTIVVAVVGAWPYKE